jgi:L-alanine-DL-glutamate epimerase-like enolase superfamily enzyme
VTTDDGVTGWSEFDEGFGSPGVSTVIERLAPRVVGTSAARRQDTLLRVFHQLRPGAVGVVVEAMGAIENALIDAHARTLGVPCHVVLGGRVRDRVRCYWSHAPTWRISRASTYGNEITDLGGFRSLAAEIVETGFSAAKTNMFRSRDGGFDGWVPGFGRPFLPGLTVDRALIADVHDQIEAMVEGARGAGRELDVLIDLNFNLRPGGVSQVIDGLSDLDLYWVEVDGDDPRALAEVRRRSRFRIAGGETITNPTILLGMLRAQAFDVAIVDGVWNGMWRALKMAALAEAHEVNVAPHNFYGHLATFMNLHWAAVVPNLEIMEVDVDRLPWDADVVSTVPEFVDGHLEVPDTPGWGCEPILDALAQHPPES